MSRASWEMSGDYFETCSCDYLCPCLPINLTNGLMPKGYCTAPLVYHIDQGHFGDVSLDDLNFALIIHCPEDRMSDGNWSVGVILDERASTEQRQALTTIASGQAGGVPAALAPLISTFLGVETRPIHFHKNGLSRSVSIPGVLDQALEGVPGANANEPLYMDNVDHPSNTRLALARATHSHLHAFSIDWDDESGQNNGHFAPFSWQA